MASGSDNHTAPQGCEPAHEMTVPAFQTNCALSFAFDSLTHRRPFTAPKERAHCNTHAAITCITGHTSPITGVLFSRTLIVTAYFCATMCTINHQLSAVFSGRGLYPALPPPLPRRCLPKSSSDTKKYIFYIFGGRSASFRRSDAFEVFNDDGYFPIGPVVHPFFIGPCECSV